MSLTQTTYQKAIEILKSCAKSKGFYASGLKGGYEAVWARDSMITALGASLAGEDFRKPFAQSLELLSKYSERYINLDVDSWNNYNDGVLSTEKSEPTNKLFASDLSKSTDEEDLLKITSISSAVSTCSVSLETYRVLHENYSTDTDFVREIKKYKPKFDFWEDVDIIKEKMNEIIENSGNLFKESIESFFAESNNKYKRLMDVRQAIFDNFLREIIPNVSPFCKSLWFTSAEKGSDEKTLRYGQTKFFIQNEIEDNQLPESTLYEINNHSINMLKYYNDLSEYGHTGTSDSNAEHIVRRTVSTFRGVLELNQSDKIKK